MPNDNSNDYYHAPFYDAINAEFEAAQDSETPETEMTYMVKAVSDKLNAVLDIFAGEHVVLDTPVAPQTFSTTFNSLINGDLPRPKPVNIRLVYADGSTVTTGVELVTPDMAGVEDSGYIEPGIQVTVRNNPKVAVIESVSYTVDGGDPVDIQHILDVGYRFTMPDGFVVVIVLATQAME